MSTVPASMYSRFKLDTLLLYTCPCYQVPNCTNVRSSTVRCRRLQVDTCGPVQMFIGRVQMFPRAVLYKFSFNTCPDWNGCSCANFLIGHVCIFARVISLDSCPCSQVQYCTNFFCAHLHVDSYRAVKPLFGPVSTSTLAALYRTFAVHF